MNNYSLWRMVEEWMAHGVRGPVFVFKTHENRSIWRIGVYVLDFPYKFTVIFFFDRKIGGVRDRQHVWIDKEHFLIAEYHVNKT